MLNNGLIPFYFILYINNGFVMKHLFIWLIKAYQHIGDIFNRAIFTRRIYFVVPVAVRSAIYDLLIYSVWFGRFSEKKNKNNN